MFRTIFTSRGFRFLLTGCTGILINLFITLFLTEWVLGQEQYFIAYTVGTIANVGYNFFLHTVFTFQTTRAHGKRFITFAIFSLLSTALQMLIVRTLTNILGTTYYLPIIACTIAALALLSYLYFRHTLFSEPKQS